MENAAVYRPAIYDFAKDNYDVTKLKAIVDFHEKTEIEYLSTAGVVNYIYRVKTPDGSSVIVKYAGTHFRNFPGEECPIGRQKCEYEFLQLADAVQVGIVPHVYCYDEKKQMIAMEDLSLMRILHDDIIEGKVDVAVAGKLGNLLSLIHNATYKNACPPEAWKFYEDLSSSNGKIVDEVRLKMGFQEESNFHEIRPDCLESFRKCNEKLVNHGTLDKFRRIYNENICFCHKDVHLQSVFVSDSRVAIFDCEWASLGNPASELGLTINWYLLTMLSLLDKGTGARGKIITLFKDAILKFVEGYIEGSFIYGVDTLPQQKLLTEVAGFTGIFIFIHNHYCHLHDFVSLSPERKKHISYMATDIMIAAGEKMISDLQQFISLLFSH